MDDVSTPAPSDGPFAAASAGSDPLRTSRYVAMADGVRIAIDVWLPAELPAGERIGTVVRATRYQRDHAGVGSLDEARMWCGWGYALVLIDARGTGASFGARAAELTAREVADYGEVIDWIAAQPWSNGRVGAYGGSYEGTTAERIGALGNPHVRAVAPLFPDYDMYEDLLTPGGVQNALMAENWTHMTRALDGLDGAAEELARLASEGMEFPVQPGPATPVDGPDGPALRDAAVRDHQANADMRGSFAQTPFKDDVASGWSWIENSPFSHREAAVRAGTPTFTAAGWFDSGTGDGLLSRFVSTATPQEAWLGAWNHGASCACDPFLPPDQPNEPGVRQLLERVRAFFDRHVQRGEQPAPRRTLHYYTLGRGDWRTTTRWPLPGTAVERWHLGAGNALTPDAPVEADAVDRFRTDPSASTGADNRWATQASGGGNVVYPDRAEADAGLLTYTSAPLERDLHVAGAVVLSLELSATREDGTLFAYLEDVAPDGRVTHVTEGMLRLACRRLAEPGTTPHPLRTPRTYARADAAAMVPGEVETVRLDLLSTSVLFRAGHRVRIALSGADASYFATLPADGDVEYAIHRGAARPSWVELPVAPA